MIKNFLLSMYRRNVTTKYLFKLFTSITIIILCHIYLDIKVLWMAILPISWMTIRLVYLIFLKDEVIQTENMSQKKYKHDIIGNITGIIILIIYFSIYIPHYYQNYL